MLELVTFVLTEALLDQHFSEYTLETAIVDNGSYTFEKGKA